MTDFYNVFGGTVIYPSDVSYHVVQLTANTTLDWPLETASTNVAARIVDIVPTGAYSITMPDATQTSTGQTILFNNLGPNTVLVKDAAGGTLLSLVAGEVWQVYLIDNSTSAGSWRTFKYGATTAQAQASALAGYGLVAIGSVLAQSSTVDQYSVTYTLGAPDRAKTLLWTGGLGTFNLPAAAAVGNNWFFNVRNGGSGNVVIDPTGSEQINGSATLSMAPGDSAVVVTDGSNWYTIGLGQNAVFAFDYTAISLNGLGNPSTTTSYTLSGSELNRIVYQFTGVIAGNMKIVVPPTVQQYWVDNATTGGSYTVTVATATQVSPLTVPRGQRGIYYCDGANVIKADTTASIATPLGIADGGTGATTASAALTNLGGTSVGKAVFAAVSEAAGRAALLAAPLADPTFSGNVTLSSGTVNGVAYLNASKVVTTGSGFTYSANGNLAVGAPSSGTALTVTGLTGQSAQLYSCSAAISTFATGFNVGLASSAWNIYTNGADPLAIGTGGASTLSLYTAGAPRITANSAGNVTINAPSSGEALTITAATSGNSGLIVNGGNGLPRIGAYSVNILTSMRSYDAGGFGIIGTETSHNLQIRTGDVVRATIDTSGNLGLGVTPAGWNANSLQIAGNMGFTNAGNFTANAYFNSGFKYITSGSAASTYQQASGIHTWSNAPSGTAGNAITFTEAMRLDANGQLGIGGTPNVWPSYHKGVEFGGAGLYGSMSSRADYVMLGNNCYLSSGGVNWIYKNTNQASYYLQNTGAHVWFTAGSGTAGTNIPFTQIMTLDASGNLLVGLATYSTAPAQGAVISGNSATAMFIGHANGTASGATYVGFNYNAVGIGSITQSGTTAVLYNTTSDQRLKENIEDAEDAGALIDAIKVRQFDWKTDGSHQRYGMVAQELYDTVPEAVHAPADPEDMMAVDYSKLVPLLVKEIQSLRARIAQLEQK